MHCIPRYFCSTKSSKRPSTALINHTINQNSIQLSAQTLSKISASLIIKFRQRLEPACEGTRGSLALGWGAGWHCHSRGSGKAASALSSHPQHPSPATSSKVGIAAHGNTSHCFPLSALSTQLYFWFILRYFSLFVLFLLFLLLLSFSSIPSLSTITCFLSHHPFLALSLFFPSRPPHQSKETITQRKNKSWTCANTMGQEATYGTSKSQSHEGC